MKVVVAGTRTITDKALVYRAILESGFEPTEIVCGGSRGVDAIGAKWASDHGLVTKMFIAEWRKLGPKAGPLRNKSMAEYADALVLVWDGKSKGSASMKWEAERAGLAIHEVIVAGEE